MGVPSPAVTSLRDEIAGHARWGAGNEPEIHYTLGADRMSAVHKPRVLPMYADCSAFVTCCYSWAAAPDPNGRGYDGFGFTGTLLDNLDRIDKADLLVGDLVVFGPYPGEHVVIIVETGDDPLTVSHGQERGPILIRLSREDAAHRAPTVYLRGAGLDDVPAPLHPVNPISLEDDVVFMCEFIDKPGFLWLVRPQPMPKVPGRADDDPYHRFGTREHVTDEPTFWRLASHGIPARSGKFEGMELYAEIV